MDLTILMFCWLLPKHPLFLSLGYPGGVVGDGWTPTNLKNHSLERSQPLFNPQTSDIQLFLPATRRLPQGELVEIRDATLQPQG